MEFQFYSMLASVLIEVKYRQCKSVYLAEIQEQTQCIGCTLRIIGTNCFLQGIE